MRKRRIHFPFVIGISVGQLTSSHPLTRLCENPHNHSTAIRHLNLEPSQWGRSQ